MMVETFVEHSRYISLFNETVEEEEQACIYSLSYQKTIDTVKTLSKQDPEKCPAVESICHYANTVLSENNGHLSTWLIARLIKYLIYRTKTKYIERLKVEADLDKIDEEYRTIENTDNSTSSRSSIEPQRAYSSKTEYVFNGKANIRSRVSNVSFDGPNLYVVLSGFHNPDLPVELLSVGVPLTCILEINLPGEKYIEDRETKENDIQDKTSFFEDYHINEIKLVKFWRVTHERFANLSAHPMYSNITILTINLPVFPETTNAMLCKKESLKRDIYDRILFTLYHSYELYRQHAEYLKNMKLEKRIFDKRDEVVDTMIYDDILKNIPNEYIGAPLILSAILLQVEHNLATSSNGCFLADHDTGFSDADTRHENTSTTTERSPTFNMQAKLKLLDLEYELIDEYDTSADGASQSLPSDLEVIPYGDTLSVIIRHFHDRRATYLDDAVLRVLRDPRIINVWRNHEVLTRSKSDMYFCHLDNIARAFNREQKISRVEAVHYLHLLMFDDLIFSGSSREARARLVQPPRDELSELKHMRSTIKRARSVPNFISPPTTSASELRRCKSDMEIDYCKSVVAFTECPLLFTLTDVRETLLPGYLCKNIFEKRSYRRPSLEEYEDVELLSSRVFLQVVHECFQSFDRFVARYFKPTDSLLLYFSNNDAVNNVSEERCLSSICTPIGLHEFCEYIAKKEENWIKREQETRQSQRLNLTGRFMKNSTEVEDDAIIFDDKCFILRNSLKARHLKKGLNRDGRKKIFETKEFEKAAPENVDGKKMTRQKQNESPTADNESKWADGRVMSGKTSMTEKKSDTKIDDVDTFFLPMKKILSSQCDETGGSYDFVGYDLGSLRVQVIHHSKKFLLDGDTSVRIELEDWLHGDRNLRIAVTLLNCTLRLSGRVSHRQSTGTFHLTTKRGIVLGFYRNRRELVENSSDSHWQNFTFDFRASWPSGLLIEPTIGDGTKNPFYIRQSYVSKRPGCAGAAREVCRNFLRNGTVLKYLDDNTVIIFRSNGVIVTCMDFDKPQSRDESINETDPKTEFRIKKSNSRQSVEAKHSCKVIDSTETRSNGSMLDAQPSKHIPSSEGYDSLIAGAFAVGEVLRYSVVNYDGRCYEVLNDLVVSEHDRLLVRTTLDYEVNEVFTHRADGTDTLLRSNGELVVTFPDGTCIITGYTIEEQPVICKWTKDELQYFEIMKTFEMEEYGDRVASTLSSDVEFSHESLPMPHIECQEKQTRVSIEDGFISILLTFRMEHKDYATVSYDQSVISCTLSTPDLHISISRRGDYEVSMEDQVNLKTSDNDAMFWKVCSTCGGRSISTYKFWESEVDSQTILTTVGILGDMLEINSDGTTRYHRNENYQKNCECNDDVLECEEKINSEEKSANSKARIHCKHGRYCEMLKFPVRSQYRIFAMNRDLTACEYLHRSVRREQELAAVFGDEMGMIQYPISRRPELRRLIIFVPVEPKLGSKEMFCKYRVSDKRTDYDRIELPRSTYSFPYNWLFPFGKKVVSERTRNEVLAKRNEQSLPKLLRVRVFFGIKGADRSVLIDMQRAMGRYWISVLRDGDKCRLFYATESSRLCEVENDYGSLEDGLRELAVGVKRSIDVETYVRSLQGKLIKTSTKAPRQSSRLVELQRGSMKKEYERYKQCMRKRIIVPYFGNIADSRYFLMKNHIDEPISRKSYSCVSQEKEDELIDRNKENC
ncbi:PREDICTED: uncharacterized protein LOC108751859 isoform X1 [Trachymyrmex septentrionalis]|uniref:uncharacterized protein LOC108751859 isoform X1 n=1 Tax=Trachymyrmex septentrionalis TaxID=34720 RepID=UPI00084EF7E9|nr:PREDICTED: uncharacterized protein LOC108751859 isoform X1 [Trachymyrmex septentrionalis]